MSDEHLRNLPVPFYSQRKNEYIWHERYTDEKEAEKAGKKVGDCVPDGKKVSMACNSCNLTSLWMILRYYGVSIINPDAIMKEYFENPNNLEFLNKHPDAEAVEKWENIKSKEHGNITHTERLTDVPKSLPALIRGEKVQKRAADVGFDWDNIEPAIEKVREELEEFCLAKAEANYEGIFEELGDLLFSVINVSRFAKIDPEEALNRSTEKFIDRFRMIEEAAKESGKNLENMSLEEMDELWDVIKSQRA